MTSGKSLSRKHPLTIAIIFSVGVHVLLFFLLGASHQWMVMIPAAISPKEVKNPLVFDLIESPENLRQPDPPKDAKHVSDKNVAARNAQAPNDLPLGEAYNRGVSPRGDYTRAEASRSPNAQAPAASRQKQNERQQQQNEGSFPAPEFRRELLLNPDATNSNRRPPSSANGAPLDNPDSRAPQLGSFAINTYAWDYAPYLLWLKNRIERNIYPPPAFTYLGMISGETQLRFRIYPDGRLEALEVLNTVGHKSLMETSMRAVELSVPLRPLPADFPQPYLEVTALFEYIVQRR